MKDLGHGTRTGQDWLYLTARCSRYSKTRNDYKDKLQHPFKLLGPFTATKRGIYPERVPAAALTRHWRHGFLVDTHCATERLWWMPDAFWTWPFQTTHDDTTRILDAIALFLFTWLAFRYCFYCFISLSWFPFTQFTLSGLGLSSAYDLYIPSTGPGCFPCLSAGCKYCDLYLTLKSR